jgi:hypothetical protein
VTDHVRGIRDQARFGDPVRAWTTILGAGAMTGSGTVWRDRDRAGSRV